MPDTPGVDDASGAIQPRISETRSEEISEEELRLTRNFKATAGSVTQLSALIDSVGVFYGATHPDFPEAFCVSLSYDESVQEGSGDVPVNVYEATLKATYEKPATEEYGKNPYTRKDIWTFQTQGAPIAALFYFDGNTIKPLTNSAKDPLKGLQVDEALQKILIKGVRSNFPSALAAAVTNCVNSDSYLGFPANHVKCQGITAERKYEIVNKTTIWYWEVTVELLARQTGWNLLIPDVGYNYLEGGEKKRCKVKAPDGEGGEVDVASADPVALDGNGGQLAAGATPVVLDRRIYRQVPFSGYFGNGPN
jgi:hypothetical protein